MPLAGADWNSPSVSRTPKSDRPHVLPVVPTSSTRHSARSGISTSTITNMNQLDPEGPYRIKGQRQKKK